MSELPAPKTWKDAIPTIVWGALVFTCFFVFIEKLVEQNYGQALVALLLGLGIAAVALHSKTWLERTNPNWIFPVFLVLLIAILMLPFIEEKRWPFSAWFETKIITITKSVIVHDQPTAEELAKIAQPKIDAAIAQIRAERNRALSDEQSLRAQLAEANRENSAAQREMNAPRQQVQSLPTPNHDAPRVYTNKTIDKIFEPCEGRTQLQCDELIGDEKGKWIKLTGRINFIQPNGQVALSVDKKYQVNCAFGQKWKATLGMFRNNEMMSIRGKIQSDLGAFALILNECELDD